MKSSSKILIGGIILGVILLFVGLYLYTYSSSYTTLMPFHGTYIGQSHSYYPYQQEGAFLIILSVVCFFITGVSAAVKSGKEKRKQVLPSAPVQQTPLQSTPQQQILQPQPAQATQSYQQPPPPVQPPAPEVTQLQYCPSCGRKIKLEWSVCGYCGRKLR